MTRAWGAGAQAAMAGAHLQVLVFVEMDFAGDFVRLCNASHDVTWNTYTWLGLGQLGRIDEIEETGAVEAKGLAFEISGVPSAHLALAMNETYQGCPVRLWEAPLTEAGTFTDVRLLYVGRMDVLQVLDGENGVIRVTSESRMTDLMRPRARRYNDADQQRAYPGDRGLEFIDYLATDRQIRWGQS